MIPRFGKNCNRLSCFLESDGTFSQNVKKSVHAVLRERFIKFDSLICFGDIAVCAMYGIISGIVIPIIVF